MNSVPKKMKKWVCFGTRDRISSLPDPIRAHILSFLPSCTAVRTSILSSTWRALWTHMLSLDLSTSKLPGLVTDRYSYDKTKTDAAMAKKESYYDFLDRAFESILMLEKLKLYVPCVGFELESRLDNLLSRALGYRLFELEFEMGVKSFDDPRYILPTCVFKSSLITKLNLVNCKVDESSLRDIHLPSLCNLSLVFVFINEEAMGILFANCPNIENFNFNTCVGLERLEIFGLAKLKKAEIKYDYQNPLVIEMEAPSLLDFIYECENFHDNEGYCELYLIGCSNMKRFKAVFTALDDMDLHSLLEGSPTLERLELYHCDCLRYIEISSPHLVHLELIQCQWVRKAEVNAPNLKVFHYEDDEPIKLPLRGLTPRLKEASVYLKPDNKNDKWYAGLVMFFAKLRHSERLTLCVGTEEDLIVPQKVRMKTRPPLSGVKHLMVSLRISFMKRSPVSFVEGLLWLAPCLETITFYNNYVPACKSLQLMHDKPLKGQKKCGCWKSLPVICWRHSINKVSIENIKGGEDDTKLANFFRNARIDGKIVEVVCSSLSEPQKL